MKYLAVTGARSERELRAYLYAYAMPMEVSTHYRGVVYAVVEVPEDNAQYQADRFSSGMIAATVHDTPYDAAMRLVHIL